MRCNLLIPLELHAKDAEGPFLNAMVVLHKGFVPWQHRLFQRTYDQRLCLMLLDSILSTQFLSAQK